MDNDNSLIRILKKTVKNVKFKIDYQGYSILDAASGNETIKEIIQSAKPAMVARCGATEMRCIGEFLATGTFSDTIRKEICELSGVFPTSDIFLTEFCEFYMDSVGKSDILALWGVGAESKVVKAKCSKDTKYVQLTSLEPYYFEKPWSKALKEKKVLIIHPFVESIKKQYENREKLFLNCDILPRFASLTCIHAIQSIAGEKTEFDTWFDALEYMKKQIKTSDFEVAIIGAGAYGLPLAAYVKELGKIAIQMSGSTQILFGIKGKRWEHIPQVSKMFNEYWIRPTESETPKNSEKVEGGSYW